MIKTLMIRSALLAFTCSISVTVYAIADSPKQVNVPPGDLVSALESLAQQADLSLVYQVQQLSGIRTRGVSGNLTPQDAVRKLLQGTKLHLRMDEATGAMLIESSAEKARSAGAGASSSDESISGSKSFWDHFRLAQTSQNASSVGDAEQGSPADTANAEGLQEVIVTAQKREERLQDVPMTVNVITADELLSNHEIQLQDYLATVPAVAFTQVGSGASSQITIRGLSSVLSPTVGITIDDIPVGLTNTAPTFGNPGFVPNLDPADLKSVEVLQGPQGTLYGASSIGGIVKYITVPPDLTAPFGRVQLDGSVIPDGGAGYGVRGAVNIPIIDNVFGIRISAFDRLDPGFIDDPTHNVRNFNEIKAYGGRFDSLWQATSNLTVRISALFDRSAGIGAPVDTAYTPGELRYAPLTGDLSHFEPSGTSYAQLEHELYSAAVKWTLQSFDVTSITSLGLELERSFSDYTYAGLDDGPYPAPLQSQCPCGGIDPNSVNSNKFNQEIRLASHTGGKLDWLVGGYFTREAIPSSSFDLRLSYLQSGISVPGGNLYGQTQTQSYHEYAGFANVDYHFTQQFDIEAGLRESHNWQAYDLYPANGLFAGGAPTLATTSKDNSLTFSFSPRYRFSESLMSYARISSGYQPGGPNDAVPNPTVDASYGPTTSVNYELGIKSSFLDQRVTIDAAVFDDQWSHVQLQAVYGNNLFNYLYNGGSAQSRGAEGELKLRPIDSFTLSATLAYVDAILTQSVAGNPGVAGNWLPYGSRWSGSVSAEQRFNISASTTGFVGATWAYVGERYSGYNTLNPGGAQNLWPSYYYANARVGLRSGAYTVTAFVNNCTNQRGILSSFPEQVPPFTPAVAWTTVITPRIAGISFSRNFR